MSVHEQFAIAAHEKRRSFVGELVGFMGATKRYWLLPIVLGLAMLAVLVALGASPAAPFIYTLF